MEDSETISRAASTNIIMQTTQRIPESPDDPTLREVLCNIQTKDANAVLQRSSAGTLVSRQTLFLYDQGNNVVDCYVNGSFFLLGTHLYDKG